MLTLYTIIAVILIFVLSTFWTLVKSKSKIKNFIKYVDRRGFTLLVPQMRDLVRKSGMDLIRAARSGQLKFEISHLKDIYPLSQAGIAGIFGFSFRVSGLDVMVFSFHPKSTPGQTQATGSYRVASIEVESVNFRLSRRSNVVEKISQFVQSVTGESDGEVEELKDVLPEASRTLWAVHGADQEAVQAYFDDTRCAFLENYRGDGIIASNSKHIVIIERGGMSDDPAELDAFVTEIKSIIEGFIDTRW